MLIDCSFVLFFAEPDKQGSIGEPLRSFLLFLLSSAEIGKDKL